jgi:hypothetical protein
MKKDSEGSGCVIIEELSGILMRVLRKTTK